ncbi:MAG: lipoyl(octanoyl) transferase LipB [Candidatus Eiseniibacteriota bacterium]
MRSTGWPSISSGHARSYWLGRIGYLEAAALQHALVEQRKRDEIPDTFLFLEHPPVVTLGRASHEEHLLAPPAVLAARGVEVFETTRGGDVTFHGPGQLVGYGIVDLKHHGRDVALYLRKLEEAVIGLLAKHGLTASRHAEFTGVWLEREKVCAMGVRVDHWVTSHGFALNVSNELSFFDLIVPCGIRGYGVTSLERATGRAHELSGTAAEAAAALSEVFGWRIEALDGATLVQSVGQITPVGEKVLGGVRRVFPEPRE